MHARSPSLLAALAFAAAAWMVPAEGAAAAPEHLIPQSLQLRHKETLEQITALTKREGEVGAAAAKVLVLLKRHTVREVEYIFPPLTLLPRLTDGKVTPDMAWALPMTDRVRADQQVIFDEHMKITDALNELVTAGAKVNDIDVKEFAESAVADALEDLEIVIPAVILLGDLLHSKLPAGH